MKPLEEQVPPPQIPRASRDLSSLPAPVPNNKPGRRSRGRSDPVTNRLAHNGGGRGGWAGPRTLFHATLHPPPPAGPRGRGPRPLLPSGKRGLPTPSGVCWPFTSSHGESNLGRFPAHGGGRGTSVPIYLRPEAGIRGPSGPPSRPPRAAERGSPFGARGDVQAGGPTRQGRKWGRENGASAGRSRWLGPGGQHSVLKPGLRACTMAIMDAPRHLGSGVRGWLLFSPGKRPEGRGLTK